MDKIYHQEIGQVGFFEILILPGLVDFADLVEPFQDGKVALVVGVGLSGVLSFVREQIENYIVKDYFFLAAYLLEIVSVDLGPKVI